MSTRHKTKCVRPSCSRQGWTAGFCEVHWEQMRRAGLAGLVDPGPVREHITRLHEAGFTNRDISAISDVSLTCIKRQAWHRPKRIRAGEARRILAVRLDAELPHRKNFTVDAVGFIRRVQAMCRMGWSVPLIAERAGVSHRAISDAIYNKRVSRALLRAILDVYPDLAFRPGPSKQAASKAMLKGWPTAMAWDEDIDDPAAEPNLGENKKTIGVPADELLFLRGFGWSPARIAQRFGMSEFQVRDRLRKAAA